MARIRTIKPEFPQSESMGNVSRDARLCFVMMWTLADDSGRLRGSSRMLASLLFPYDDDAPKLIDKWLAELDREQCIYRYEVDGASYIQIAKWLSHQKIDRPSESKIPPFDEASRIVAKPREYSSLDQGSRIKDQGVDQGVERSQAIACTTPPPAGLDPIAWEAWVAYRKAKKKPIRPESIEAAQKDLAKYGANQQAVVHQSIAAGYQGLFDLKTTAAGRPPPPPRGTRDDEAKRLLFGEQGDVIDA